jgi:hypothetical protein
MPTWKEQTIGEVIAEFVEQVESLSTSLSLAMHVIQLSHRRADKSYNDFIEKHCKEENKDGESYILVPIEQDHRFTVLKKRVRRTATSFSVVPRSFLVSLVSSYDAFLGKLVGVLFRTKPEMLKSSDRTMTYSQLSEFSSIVEAREHLLDKEVETLLRKSHGEQFDWLENKFSIKLRVDLPVWPAFIEVTERRNLFVHADGIVSNQYLKLCKDLGYPIAEKVDVGSVLGVSPAYFQSAYEAIFEVAVKLGQVLWRKIKPDDLEDADIKLSDICYDLLEEKKYKLAQKLLDFASSAAMKHSNEKSRLIFLVNRTQAYKWDGQAEEASRIVESQDWSATEATFQLAASVLRDRFDEATHLIEKIGANGYPTKVHYKTWPLFQEIRKNKKFAEVFEKVFGDPLEKTLIERTNPSTGDAAKMTPEKKLPKLLISEYHQITPALA